MANNSFPDHTFLPEIPFSVGDPGNTRVYNIRTCPSCGQSIFGMPGGRDAHCPECGYKDPCCSD